MKAGFDFIIDDINKTTYITLGMGRSFQAIKVSRSYLQKIKNDEKIFIQLNKPGVYVLLGSRFSKEIYVGQSNNVFGRLQQQLRDKLFWEKAVIFGLSNNDLIDNDAKYLEQFLISCIKKTDYVFKNEIISSNIYIKESQKRKLEEIFFDNMKMILFDTGWDIDPMQKIEIEKPPLIKTEKIFYLNFPGGKASGRLLPDSNKFEVLSESFLRKEIFSSLRDAKIVLREKLQKDGVIGLESNNLLFLKNYIFESPSSAATIICGHSASGPESWKDENGIKLREIIK